MHVAQHETNCATPLPAFKQATTADLKQSSSFPGIRVPPAFNHYSFRHRDVATPTARYSSAGHRTGWSELETCDTANISVSLTNVTDFKNLCAVSKSLYTLGLPFLYRSITLEASEEGDLEDIEMIPLLRAKEKGLLRHTRAITVQSRYPATWKRCFHSYDLSWVDEVEVGDNDDLLFLLEGLQDGSLQSFTWNLGTCVPQSILGPSGYLPLRQPRIESLRLVADGGCSWSEDHDYRLVLSAFRHLRCLSWAGLWRDEDRDALADVLQQVSGQLVEFELDLIHCRNLDAQFGDPHALDDPGEFTFARDTLRLPRAGTRIFPSLRVLSLSGVSFAPDLSDIMHQFDWGVLRSLTLRFCPGWTELLENMTRSGQPIRLRFLEIQSSGEDDWEGDVIIQAFLDSFDGLESFFLASFSPVNTLGIWQAAAHHRATLRRFVHHQRSIHTDQGSHLFGEPQDLPDLSFCDIADLGEDPSQNPLGDLDLECVGLCCVCEFLKSIISPFVNKHTLQILHLRRSGPDFAHYADWSQYFKDNSPHERESRRKDDGTSSDHGLSEFGDDFEDFAQWVFGPNGIPSLRLLAFGDFSYRGRFVEYNHLLCRKSHSQAGHHRPRRYFRTITDDDNELWDLFDKHHDALEACPTDSLFTT